MTDQSIGVAGDPAGHTGPSEDERVFARADLVAMLLFLVLGIAIIVRAFGLRVTNALGVGPGMFPLVSGILIAGLGLIGTVVRLRQLRALAPVPEATPAAVTEQRAYAEPHIEEYDSPADIDESFTTVNWVRVALALVLVVAFVVLVPVLGFVTALTLLTLGLMVLVAGRGWLPSVLVALGTGALTYYGFGLFLNVQLPSTSLIFLTWLDT